MRVAYYPGCSLEGSASDFGRSVEEAARRMGAELVEIEDWSCCGASAAHSLNHLLGIALPARNAALARAQGFDRILAPCAACSNRLISALAEMREKPDLRAKVEDLIGMPVDTGVRILNLLDFVEEYGLEPLRQKVTQPLSGLKVACYYGCLLVRPPKVVRFDDPEQPESMERIVRTLGAEPVDWGFRVECCGAALTMPKTEVVTRLVRDILRNAEANGAEAVAVSCPLCHQNLDLRQLAVNSEYGEAHRLPVYYVSELIALALGASPREAGLDRHFVESVKTIEARTASKKG